ncbi:hypothetical protein PHMEG_0003777 [Phytophthora megakarya]|uniref:Uncharacterized protein n=1 Tax=Phytophthora megakarya TaxID=4795 RepID=A0A225WX38_9STRA|nr:hypothetical protein PHMEG_0003777 [Phytophthora megakarya]
MSILTAQEKILIVHTHRYILAEAQLRVDPLRRTRTECLAVSESLAARVVAAYNEYSYDAFMAPPVKRGHHPSSEVEHYREFIMEVINDRNLLR